MHYTQAMTAIIDPLTSPPPSEVPLRNAPLVRVIAQVRFPIIASIVQRDFIAPFQEAIRSRYPVLRGEHSQGIGIGPDGVRIVSGETIWRFSDLEGQWRLSLAPGFMALETTAYVSRDDFLSRLKQVLEALSIHMTPGVVDRLGVRYIDRVTGPAVEDIQKLVRPEVLGIAATPMANRATLALTETVFSMDRAELLARWGHVPAQGSVDPSALEPVPESSWILDLDMYTTAPQAFESQQILELAQGFAERIYTFFRWTVTDAFLSHFGGEA